MGLFSIKSRKVNGKAIAEGRCKVVEASVAELPLRWKNPFTGKPHFPNATRDKSEFVGVNETNRGNTRSLAARRPGAVYPGQTVGVQELNKLTSRISKNGN